MPNKEPTSDDEGGRKFFIWNKFSLSYSMRASHFPAYEDYIMTNKLTKAGEQFMVGEDATMVVTDQENRITKTETDFILVEQTPEPSKVLGFDKSAQLKQYTLSTQGEELLRAILPGNSFVIVDNDGHISVVSMDSGTGNLPITGGKLLGQLIIESAFSQLTVKRKEAEDLTGIQGQDENANTEWLLIYDGAANLALKNNITGSLINFQNDGQIILSAANGSNTLRLDTGDTTHVGGLTVEGGANINYLTRTGAFYEDVTGTQFEGTTEKIYGTRLKTDNFETLYWVERLENGHTQFVIKVIKDGVAKYFRHTMDGDFTVERHLVAVGAVKAGNGSSTLNQDGNIAGSIWAGGDLNSHLNSGYIQGVQYSATRRLGLTATDEIYAAAGEVFCGVDMWGGSSMELDAFYVKMTQVKIDNVWVNITG